MPAGKELWAVFFEGEPLLAPLLGVSARNEAVVLAAVHLLFFVAVLLRARLVRGAGWMLALVAPLTAIVMRDSYVELHRWETAFVQRASHEVVGGMTIMQHRVDSIRAFHLACFSAAFSLATVVVRRFANEADRLRAENAQLLKRK